MPAPASPLPHFTPAWTPVVTQGKPHGRHEAAFVPVGQKIHLLGGRRIQPVDTFDPVTHAWTVGAPPPEEVHHFQPVVWEEKIWLVGAMTGAYPHEVALDHTPIYDPASDSWSRGPGLPEGRRRGCTGAAIHEDKLYVVAGIINGHWDGHVAWFDVLDLKTGVWSQLPDAPRARDHFQASVVAGKLYVVGGRRTSAATKEVFTLMTPEVDVYDFAAGRWNTLPPSSNFPTLRAGTMNFVHGPWLVVAGGESPQPAAHNEVQALDTRTGRWIAWPRFYQGRHGSGLVRFGDALYIASGCVNRGGAPEIDTTERLELAGLPD